MTVPHTEQRKSAAYHSAHLAFSRAEIVAKSAAGCPILGLLRTYTADVVQAERDRVASTEEERDA